MTAKEYYDNRVAELTARNGEQWWTTRNGKSVAKVAEWAMDEVGENASEFDFRVAFDRLAVFPGGTPGCLRGAMPPPSKLQAEGWKEVGGE